MTSPQTPLTTRRLRAGIAGLGLVLGLTLAGCSSPAADDAATPTPSASAEAASPTPEATTEGDAGSGASGTDAATLAKVRDFTCGLKDKDAIEESDVQAYRDLATEAQRSGVPNADQYGQQINAGADQMAMLVGKPLPDDLRASLSSACDSLQ
ncbi:hypothetical protein [Clavibacter michiganensis]|uniref:hypothetical protein n=2 Tax=Clavibacter michiganensis TaxID=28447 RepID=UPI000D52D05C|nr:hypothetical protein [Clavibacter michiganensis]AWF97581.1 hypothetical protein BEH61_03595 [Clavibacter michiganensis subsp. insidiosus]